MIHSALKKTIIQLQQDSDRSRMTYQFICFYYHRSILKYLISKH